MGTVTPIARRKRDANATRAAILEAAKAQFDAIARLAG